MQKHWWRGNKQQTCLCEKCIHSAGEEAKPSPVTNANPLFVGSFHHQHGNHLQQPPGCFTCSESFVIGLFCHQGNHALCLVAPFRKVRLFIICSAGATFKFRIISTFCSVPSMPLSNWELLRKVWLLIGKESKKSSHWLRERHKSVTNVTQVFVGSLTSAARRKPRRPQTGWLLLLLCLWHNRNTGSRRICLVAHKLIKVLSGAG